MEENIQMEPIGAFVFRSVIIEVWNNIDYPLFMLSDVGRAIGYSEKNVDRLLGFLELNEKITLRIVGSYGDSGATREQDVWFVTEDGLYEILMRSRKEPAREFRVALKQNLFDMRHDYNTRRAISYSEFGEKLELLYNNKISFNADKVRN